MKFLRTCDSFIHHRCAQSIVARTKDRSRRITKFLTGSVFYSWQNKEFFPFWRVKEYCFDNCCFSITLRQDNNIAPRDHIHSSWYEGLCFVVPFWVSSSFWWFPGKNYGRKLPTFLAAENIILPTNGRPYWRSIRPPSLVTWSNTGDCSYHLL